MSRSSSVHSTPSRDHEQVHGYHRSSHGGMQQLTSSGALGLLLRPSASTAQPRKRSQRAASGSCWMAARSRGRVRLRGAGVKLVRWVNLDMTWVSQWRIAAEQWPGWVTGWRPAASKWPSSFAGRQTAAKQPPSWVAGRQTAAKQPPSWVTGRQTAAKQPPSWVTGRQMAAKLWPGWVIDWQTAAKQWPQLTLWTPLHCLWKGEL